MVNQDRLPQSASNLIGTRSCGPASSAASAEFLIAKAGQLKPISKWALNGVSSRLPIRQDRSGKECPDL